MKKILILSAALLSVAANSGFAQANTRDLPVVLATVEYVRSQIPDGRMGVVYGSEEYRLPKGIARAVAERLNASVLATENPIQCSYSPEGRQSCALAEGNQTTLMTSVDERSGRRAVVRVQVSETVDNEVFYHYWKLELKRGKKGWAVSRILSETIT